MLVLLNLSTILLLSFSQPSVSLSYWITVHGFGEMTISLLHTHILCYLPIPFCQSKRKQDFAIALFYENKGNVLGSVYLPLVLKTILRNFSSICLSCLLFSLSNFKISLISSCFSTDLSSANNIDCFLFYKLESKRLSTIRPIFGKKLKTLRCSSKV